MQYGSIVTWQISIATHYRYLETHQHEQLRFSDQLRQKIQRTFQDKLSFMLLVSVTLSINKVLSYNFHYWYVHSIIYDYFHNICTTILLFKPLGTRVKDWRVLES